MSSRDVALLIEIPETLNSLVAERRRIPSDGRLARLFDTRQPPVQSCDQLVELTGEIVRR